MPKAIRQIFVAPKITKPGGPGSAGNFRGLELNGNALKWRPGINRDKLMGNMKAFEVVTPEMLNESWASQEVSLPEGTAIALIANRVKGMRENAEVWKLEIDTNAHEIVSAEIAPGKAW